MCKVADAGKDHHMKDNAQPEYVAKYVPAPEVGDGKLWLVGTCTRFNKDEKPAGLTNLSDGLFYSFTKDIQLSMCGHWTSYWHILVYILLMSASASVALYFFVLPVYLVLYFAAASMSFATILLVGNRSQLKDLQNEIEDRIEEWKPLFSAEGFSAECMVDKRCWRPTGLFIHIKQSSTGKRPKPSAPVIWSWYGEQQVKYMVLFARMFSRRNKMCRVILTSKEMSKDIYVKPPALESLSDAVFQRLIKDVNKAVRAFMVKKRNINCFLLAISELTFFFWTPRYMFLPVSSGWMFFFFFIDQLASDHFLFPKSGIPECIHKWKPCLKANGFTLEYRVDQPSWYSWKESFILIQRHNSSFGA